MPYKRGKSYIVFKIVCTASVFAFLSVFYLAVMVWNGMSLLRSQREEVMDSEVRMTQTEHTVINTKMNVLAGDLRFIHDTVQMTRFNPAKYGELKKLWSAYANRQKIYDQIRYIDKKGNEIIRINYKPDTGAYAVRSDELQNKADLYYFQDAIKMEDGRMYVSKLDLNIEGKTLEKPIKPMIRLAMPCFDSDGELKGIVCLNYLAEDLLKRIRNVASAGYGIIYMLNPEGYWFFNGEDRSTEWAFMYPDRQNVSFASRFSDVWGKMKKTSDGCIVAQQGIFTYEKILASKEGNWTIVSYIPDAGPKSEPFSWDACSAFWWIIKRNLPALLVIFALAAAVSVIISNSKNKKDLMRYYSEYDEMTGMLNRRAGLERLDSMTRRKLPDRKRITICFIDINGLKYVNDKFGHEAGDEMILTVIRAIRTVIRKEDFLVRLGGDEFLAVFENMTMAEAEGVWKRIAEEMEEENRSEKRKFIVSASHGCASIAPGESIVDEAMRLADERMYEEKRRIKKEQNPES